MTAPAAGRRRGNRLRRLTAPFTHLYARGLFAGVLLQVLAVMAMVEAIFLAERFPMVFRDVIRNNASLLDTSLIFVCNSTQIFDLALAIAILMAVYWTVLRMRENRELLVVSAAGTGLYRLIALIMAIAVVAQACSLFVSGVADPASRYAQRVILFKAKFRALQGGINTGQFYFFPNRVAFAPAQAAAGRDRSSAGQSKKLFIYEQVNPESFRVITADHAVLDGPDAAGRILLVLDGFISRTFVNGGRLPAAAPTPGASKDAPRMTLSAHDVTQEMTMNQLLTFLPRGSEAVERTVFEQFGMTANDRSRKHRDEMRLLGERIARSLLCLLAPLIALASVCLTVRATNYIALPLACMVLMVLNVTSAWLIRAIVPLTPLGALAVPAALTAAFAVLLFATIVRRQSALVRPQLARP
jgi:lipopolysaccharide export system permease protein